MDSVSIIKFVSALLYPLGLALVFAVLSLLSRIRRRRLSSKVFAFLAVLIVFASSNPIVATSLVSSLERQYPQLTMELIPKHDAIIVLGGGLRLPSAPAKQVQIGHGSDRYWYAAQLFHAGKAAKIVLSGGNVYPQQGLQSEAYYAAELLQQWGVPASAIQIERDSRTTAENHANTANLIDTNEIQSALLVTSAIHMPRAYKLFSRLAIPLTPASADVLIRQQYSPAVFNYLPSASALNLSTVALHEYYGMWFDWLKARF